MPVKRRAGKARVLDDLMMEDMFYGPGTCLLNGCGYLAPYDDGLWRDKSDEVKAAVIDAMRTDWERHRASILTAWERRTPHELWCARRHHGDPAEPWAFTEFGEPT